MFKCKIPLNEETESAIGKQIHRLIEDIPSFGAELVLRLTAQVERLLETFSEKEKALDRQETIFGIREDNCARREASAEGVKQRARERGQICNEREAELRRRERDLENEQKIHYPKGKALERKNNTVSRKR